MTRFLLLLLFSVAGLVSSPASTLVPVGLVDVVIVQAPDLWSKDAKVRVLADDSLGQVLRPIPPVLDATWDEGVANTSLSLPPPKVGETWRVLLTRYIAMGPRGKVEAWMVKGVERLAPSA